MHFCMSVCELLCAGWMAALAVMLFSVPACVCGVFEDGPVVQFQSFVGG